MTAAATSSTQPAPPLSRLARIGAGLGLWTSVPPGASQSPRQYTDANDAEWYIPYNGPYEEPKDAGGMGGRNAGKGKDRDTGGWGERGGGVLDPFERDRGAFGHGGGSASGHGHGHGSSAHGHVQESFYDEDRGRARARGFSASSKYSESIATLGGGGGGGDERRGRAVVSPIASPVSPRVHNNNVRGVGIGESPIPAQRFSHPHGNVHGHGHGHGHASGSGQVHDLAEHTQPQHGAPSTASQRESFASFWTFGRTTSRKSASPIVPSIHSGGGGRPSVETHFSRPSMSAYHATPQGGTHTRDRSATIGGRSQVPANAHLVRPRANTAVPPAHAASSSAPAPPMSQQRRYNEQVEHVPPTGLPEAIRATSPYERHPYAVAFPSAGHREHSRYMGRPSKPSSREQKPPTLNLTVPFLSSSKSFASLRNSTSKLKASVSTPNLRGAGAQHAKAHAGGGSSANSPSPSSASGKWLSAETWCDALLFPARASA
ncbi:hypothetical protein DFH11DRAFT_825152 [Phellopilus nigrolimitatus]|nr:hypothetical protein DFH11DRAFT_825152 [Phellopilus nigrolimitatus]